MAGFPYFSSALTVLMLGVGGAMLTFAYRDQQAFHAINERGREVEADIVDAFGKSQNAGTPPIHLVRLSWIDRQGQVRTHPPVRISASFWRTISSNDVWTVKTTKIRYLEDQSTVRPVIVGDMAEREYQDWFGIRAGLAFLLVGLGGAAWVVRAMRRA